MFDAEKAEPYTLFGGIEQDSSKLLPRVYCLLKITVYRSIIKCSIPYRQSCTRYLVYRTEQFQVVTPSLTLNAIIRQQFSLIYLFHV